MREKDWGPGGGGGETSVGPVSATKGIGIDELLENMSALAEVMELKASPTATPRGTVIEAQVEPGRGPAATVSVQMGTLKVGDPFISGLNGFSPRALGFRALLLPTNQQEIERDDHQRGKRHLLDGKTRGGSAGGLRIGV